MDSARNPYVTGKPVVIPDPGFIAREDFHQKIMNLLQSGKSVVLQGQRRSGKTSMLRSIRAQLRQMPTYKPIYFDLQAKASRSFQELLVDLSRTIAQELELKEPLPILHDHAEFIFRGWLQKVLDAHEDERLVLLFDEFDDIQDLKPGQAAHDFFPFVDRLLELDGKNLNIVMALGRNTQVLKDRDFLLSRQMITMSVSNFSSLETEQLIRISEKYLDWSQGAIDSVWEYTQGQPYLTQALCAHIWNNVQPDVLGDVRVPVTPENVEMAVRDTLETSGNMLHWLWRGFNQAQRVIATAIAQSGQITVDVEELAHILARSGIQIQGQRLVQELESLRLLDFLEKTPTGYGFQGKLVRQWISENKSVIREALEISGASDSDGISIRIAENQDDIVSFIEFTLDLDPQDLTVELLRSLRSSLAHELEVSSEDIVFLGFKPGSIQFLVAITGSAVSISENVHERLVGYKLTSIVPWKKIPELLTFISYAREDLNTVREIYSFLDTQGLRPWLDLEDIFAGEQWRPAILRAIRRSTAFVFCLSSASRNPRPVLLAENQEAVARADQLPEDAIYFVPLRIDGCDIPPRVAKFNVLDWDNGNNKGKLAKALREGLKRLGRLLGS